MICIPSLCKRTTKITTPTRITIKWQTDFRNWMTIENNLSLVCCTKITLSLRRPFLWNGWVSREWKMRSVWWPWLTRVLEVLLECSCTSATWNCQTHSNVTHTMWGKKTALFYVLQYLYQISLYSDNFWQTYTTINLLSPVYFIFFTSWTQITSLSFNNAVR